MITKLPTLLVLAAGMGSRYGSLKQLDQFGPHGETIIEYSIYDAIRAGFKKVVFVIRKSIEEPFKNEMLHKFSDKIAVKFVLQELDMLPDGFSLPVDRQKPWGTGHAVWVASGQIDEPFAVINADDFYGYESLKLMSDFLVTQADEGHYGLIGYEITNTLSPHGAVSRGICEMDANGYLESVSEQTHIAEAANGIICRNTQNTDTVLTGNEIVSMNLMGFTPSVFPYFEFYFKEFLRTESSENPKAEFYLPEVVNKIVKAGTAKVKVLPSTEKWFGVTFPEDKQLAIQKINELITGELYPEHLWKAPIE